MHAQYAIQLDNIEAVSGKDFFSNSFVARQYLINLDCVKLEKQNIQIVQGDNETITISVASTTSHEALLTGNSAYITLNVLLFSWNNRTT